MSSPDGELVAILLGSKTRRSIQEMCCRIGEINIQLFDAREGFYARELCDKMQAAIMVIRSLIR